MDRGINYWRTMQQIRQDLGPTINKINQEISVRRSLGQTNYVYAWENNETLEERKLLENYYRDKYNNVYASKNFLGIHW